MDQSEHAIAGLGIFQDDAECVDIAHILEVDPLLLELAPNGVGAFLPPVDAGFDAVRVHHVPQGHADLGDQAAGLDTPVVEPFGHRLEGRRIEVTEGEVLELGAYAIHADTAGERRVDLESLAGNGFAALGLRVVLERSHIVETVAKLHQKHADVPAHGEDEFLEVLGLLSLARSGRRGQLELSEFRHSLDEFGDLRRELVRKLLVGDVRILQNVVKQRRADRGDIEVQRSENACDFDGMGVVRVARVAHLVAMRLDTEDVGLVQEGLVHTGIVCAHTIHQLPLAEDLRLRLYDRLAHARNIASARGCRKVLETGVGPVVAVALEGTEKIGLGHLLGLSLTVREREHGGLLLFLRKVVIGDDALKVGDEGLAEVSEVQLLGGEFAEGNDGCLVVVAIDHEVGTLRDIARAVSGKEHEVEAVRDLVDAVFNGNAGHGAPRKSGKSRGVSGNRRQRQASGPACDARGYRRSEAWPSCCPTSRP